VPLTQGAVEVIERVLMATAAPMAFIMHDLNVHPLGQVMTISLKRNARSIISMILVIEGERVGTLVIKAEGTDRHTQEHAEFIDTVNDPICIAVSNALRFQELALLEHVAKIHHRTDFSAQLKKDGTSREDCGRL